jgi:hypothetical protein
MKVRNDKRKKRRERWQGRVKGRKNEGKTKTKENE